MSRKYIIGSSMPVPADHVPSTQEIDKDTKISISVYMRPSKPYPETIDRTKPMTREEVNREYCVKIDDLNMLNGFVGSYGLKAKLTHSRRVNITGTLEQFGEAFGVSFEYYITPEGIPYLTHREDLSIPEDLFPAIIAVLGLDTRPVV